MPALESVTEELKSLPAAEFEEAARFIHSLKASAKSKKKAILEKTFGATRIEDAERLAKDIEEGCEQIDLND